MFPPYSTWKVLSRCKFFDLQWASCNPKSSEIEIVTKPVCRQALGTIAEDSGSGLAGLLHLVRGVKIYTQPLYLPDSFHFTTESPFLISVMCIKMSVALQLKPISDAEYPYWKPSGCWLSCDNAKTGSKAAHAVA